MKTLLFLLLAAGALRPAHAQTLTAEWAVQCATNGQPYSLVVDAQGNSYVAGTFGGTITLGSTTLTATQIAPGYNAPQDVFLAKLDPQGQYQWAMQFGDGQGGVAHVGAVDNVGNLYVSGSFRSYSYRLGATGPLLYNSSNKSEGFIARFSAQTGQCQWARRFGGTGDDYAGSLALNANDELYITGQTGSADADFGSAILPAAPSGRIRGFLAKLTAAGGWQWAKQLGSNGDVFVGSLLCDGLETLYLSGSFSSPGVTLGATALITHQLTGWGNAPGSDVFVAKLNAAGTVRWVVQGDATGANNAHGGGLAYDGQGHLFASGYFNSRTLRLGGISLTNASAQYPQPIPAPPTPYTENIYADAWVARLDTTGGWQWGVRRGGAYDEYTGIVSLTATGQALVSIADYNTPAYTLASFQPATGAWLTDYALPVPFGLTQDVLGRQYVWGTFSTSTLNLGGQVVPNAGANIPAGFVARLGALPLSTRSSQVTSPILHAWPTPGPGTDVWVQGAPAGQAVEMFDVLGRRVGGGIMPTSGPLRLSWAGGGLTPGVYIVRSGQASTRWMVEN